MMILLAASVETESRRFLIVPSLATLVRVKVKPGAVFSTFFHSTDHQIVSQAAQ